MSKTVKYQGRYERQKWAVARCQQRGAGGNKVLCRVYVGVVPPLFVLQVMDTSRNPKWEEEHCAPVRACGTKDGGRAPGPSTSKGDIRKM